MMYSIDEHGIREDEYGGSNGGEGEVFWGCLTKCPEFSIGCVFFFLLHYVK